MIKPSAFIGKLTVEELISIFYVTSHKGIDLELVMMVDCVLNDGNIEVKWKILME